MLKIAEMNYSGANSIFLRIFFDKKYALPYRVVDAAVGHFIRLVLVFYTESFDPSLQQQLETSQFKRITF